MKNLKKLAFICLLSSSSLFGQIVELSATVASDNEKYITSRFMGYVNQVFVNDGQRVTKGDKLYEIDSKEMDANKLQVELMIEQAKLAVSMRENQYNDVNRNYERFKRLYEKGLVSKYEVEQLELHSKNLANMVKIANKQLSQAQEQLKVVENQYKYLLISAPNDGVIVRKMVKAGEMAMPGMPAVVLSDLESLIIKTEISESELNRIKVGQDVSIDIPSIKYKTSGKIKAIIPSSNPMTHTFAIKIDFKKNEFVYPGMYAKVFIDLR
jgi:RND family efflux transporter MFP subunit